MSKVFFLDNSHLQRIKEMFFYELQSYDEIWIIMTFVRNKDMAATLI